MMRMPVANARSRGASMILALAAMIFAGVAITALAMIVKLDARQTWAADRDAQLRQIMLANAQHVLATAPQWSAQVPVGDAVAKEIDSIALPQHLVDLEAAVETTVRRGEDERNMLVNMKADMKGRSLSQTLTLQKVGERYSLIDATLDRPRGMAFVHHRESPTPDAP